MAVKSAVKSALADGKVTDEERKMIEDAVRRSIKGQEEQTIQGT